MRVPTLHNAQRAFEAIEQRLSRQAQIQDQLGTGLRVSRPGDDPLSAAQAELARSRLARLGQDQRAAQLATGLLSTAEGALGQGVNLLQSARELLVAAGNGAYSAAERKALALQLRSLREEMLAVANTGDGAGSKVFGGQGMTGAPASGSAPDWQAPAGTQRIGEGGRYAASVDGRAAFMAVPQGNGVFVTASEAGNTGSGWIDPGTVGDATQLTSQRYRIEIGGTPGSLSYTVHNLDTGTATTARPLPEDGSLAIDGQRVKIGGTPAPGDGFALSPARSQSVFETLDQAITLMEADPQPSGGQYAERLQRVQTTLDRALDGLSILRSQVGGELQRVESAQASNEMQELAETTRRSELQDLDYAQAISELQNNQTGLEAALRAYASVGKTNLFQMI